MNWKWIVLFLLLLFVCLLIYHFSIKTSTTSISANSNPFYCPNYSPIYDPSIWEQPAAIEYNNCYSYAFRNLDLNAWTKPQPGDKSGYATPSKYTCDNLFERVTADNPGVMRWNSNSEPCPCTYYKTFLAIDNTPPNTDYHFLRQDKDGIWSHKPGSMQVTRLDAEGNVIVDPMTANLNFEHFQYNVKCGYMCVPYEDHTAN